MEEERERMSLALLSVSDSPVLCSWSKSKSCLHHCKPGAFVGADTLLYYEGAASLPPWHKHNQEGDKKPDMVSLTV